LNCLKMALAFMAFIALGVVSPRMTLAAADTADTARDAESPCETILYSTNPSYPPYDWAVSDVAFAGASVELLQMAVPESLKLQPVVYPWKRALFLAGMGQIDLLLSLRITPERQQYLEFTRHQAFPNPIVVFARTDHSFRFGSWEDLKPLTGGVSQGDTFGGGFDQYIKQELRIESAPTMEENFQKLLAGRIDYFVSGYYLGMTYILAHDLEGKIAVIGDPVSSEGIHFAMSRKSRCKKYLEAIDARLDVLGQAGTPERLLDQAMREYVAAHHRGQGGASSK
jgi:polar amino acid transport system substrate-binding protein